MSDVTLNIDEARALARAVLGDRFEMTHMNSAMQKLTDALDKADASESEREGESK